MNDQFHAQFTRDDENRWLITVDSDQAAHTSLMVERKHRGPVRMRTGRLLGEHPKRAGWFLYERLSKAPTSGRMGTNADADGADASTPGGGGGRYPEPRPAGDAPTPPPAPSGDTSQYVTRPEWQTGRDQDLAHVDAVATEVREQVAALDHEVRAAIISARRNAPIVVKAPSRPDVVIPGGETHAALPAILRTVSLGIHTYLVGPAGTGKTTLALQAAKALGRKLSIMGALMTKHEVIGYMEQSGRYVTTAAREAFEHGHLLNLDEVDGSAAVAIVAINAMLANQYFTFPDKTVERHPDFVVIACGNTYGTGADREYVGRFQLDAASLDRFAMIEVDYDEELERRLGIAHYQAYHEQKDQADLAPAHAWIAEVQAARAAIRERRLRHVVSPRATIAGAQMLATGCALSMVRTALLVKGASEDVQAALESARA